MIIDSHLHIWTLARGDYHWLTAELGSLYADHALRDITTSFKQQGVQKCILVQAAATMAETHYLLAQAKANSQYVAGVVGWIDFASNQALQDLNELCREPLLRGIRPMLQDICPDDWILQNSFDAVFQVLIKHDLVFDALVRRQQLPFILELARRYPALKIVIDHCGKPDLDSADQQLWLADLTSLAQCPLVFIKLSGLPAQSSSAFNAQHAFNTVRQLITLFGAERVLWGSDWPVVKLGSDYPSWLQFCLQCCQTLQLDVLQQHNIFYQTATHVYGLPAYPENNL